MSKDQNSAHTTQLEARINAFKAVCREHDMRVTSQRLEIFKTVATSKSHPSAETVFGFVREKMPGISLDTVYRTLASLEELDIIFRVGLMSKARFDADKSPHCHFVCMDCGEVYDVFLDAPPAAPAGVRLVGEVKNINLQYRGICKSCGAKEGQKKI